MVVVCAGLSAKRTGADGYAGGFVFPALEKESLDRTTLVLPQGQRDLIKGQCFCAQGNEATQVILLPTHFQSGLR